ncbi:HK97 family phage prohead protease [Bradyrhizobium sp. 23]|uniref:HK97 family phage prohead protease n=1 Tax=Bradyrhizobium sp. 23 TaxID=2782667 RepID=UPI001FFB0CEF|nr:HK97 family phage prohead protease [Bradyrhizobium sp. 23]MCK1313706.1 HK97 family phage prohead protease [Bradyrhizobium sp. 23]
MTTNTKETGNCFEFDVKAVAEDGTFSGYASVFGVTDLGGDSVQPGAFTKSLKSKPAAKVKMLRGHDTSEPIGVWTSIVEDSRGLKATGRLILDTNKGRETYALLKAGALDGLSIGYRTKKESFDRTKKVRLLNELELHEVSIVTFPMNPTATISRVKSTDFSRLVAAINRATAALH